MAANFTIESHENTAVLRLDDGKANVIGLGFGNAISSALKQFENDIDALIITGNAKALCSGYDLTTVLSGDAAAINRMVIETWRMWLQLYRFNRPVVTAVSGHALGMGAYLALTGDRILSATGGHGIGFTEVAVGVALTSPPFIEPIARRVPASYLEQVILHAKRYTPDEAIQSGLCDQVIDSDQLITASLEYSQTLAKLPTEAFAQTKQALRKPCADAIDKGLDFWQQHGYPPNDLDE